MALAIAAVPAARALAHGHVEAGVIPPSRDARSSSAVQAARLSARVLLTRASDSAAGSSLATVEVVVGRVETVSLHALRKRVLRLNGDLAVPK